MVGIVTAARADIENRRNGTAIGHASLYARQELVEQTGLHAASGCRRNMIRYDHTGGVDGREEWMNIRVWCIRLLLWIYIYIYIYWPGISYSSVDARIPHSHTQNWTAVSAYYRTDRLDWIYLRRFPTPCCARNWQSSFARPGRSLHDVSKWNPWDLAATASSEACNEHDKSDVVSRQIVL